MSSQAVGWVLEVTPYPLGSVLLADAPIGATVLAVEDAVDFDTDGGTLDIDGTILEYVSADPDADTVTLAEPLAVLVEADEHITSWDLDNDAPHVEVSALVELRDAGDDDDPVPCRLAHSLTGRLPHGDRLGRGETVAVENADGIWWIVDILGVDGYMQSPSYVDGEAGWLLSEQKAQFENLSVLQELGADYFSAREINLDGEDLATSLASLSRGAAAWGRATAGADSITMTSASGNKIIAVLNAGSLEDGHLYLVTWKFSANPSGAMQLRGFLAYSNDGSSVNASSPLVPGSMEIVHSANNQLITVNGVAILNTGGTIGQSRDWKIGIGALTNTAGQSFFVRFQAVTEQVSMSLIDLGPAGTAIDGAVALKNISDGGGGATSQSDTKQTYKKTFTASSSQTWRESGSKRTDVGNDMFQGYYGSNNGNQRSLALFGNIAGAIPGGATIKKVELTFRVKHSYWGAGLRTRVLAHNRTNLDTYSSQGEVYDAGSKKHRAGSTYTVTLPNSFGNDLRDGVSKGIGFGPGQGTSRDWYGAIYGAGSGSAPKLKITYEA